MKLREINTENEFMVIIKSDFRDADYFEKESTHPNIYYEETMAFLTIIQDIYNKKHELQENQKKFFDIAKYLDEYIIPYKSLCLSSFKWTRAFKASSWHSFTG